MPYEILLLVPLLVVIAAGLPMLARLSWRMRLAVSAWAFAMFLVGGFWVLLFWDHMRGIDQFTSRVLMERTKSALQNGDSERVLRAYSEAVDVIAKGGSAQDARHVAAGRLGDPSLPMPKAGAP
jgi:hypothetical protein